MRHRASSRIIRILNFAFLPVPPRPRISPYLLLTLTSLFWAGNWVIGRAIRHDVPPIALAFWRWVVALLLLPHRPDDLHPHAFLAMIAVVGLLAMLPILITRKHP